MSLCFEESLKYVMKLVACCETYSKFLTGVLFEKLHELACTTDVLEKTLPCDFIKVLTRPKQQDLIYDLIRVSGMCTDNCPLDMKKLSRFDVRSEKLKLRERQFDTASTSALFEDVVCEISAEEVFRPLIHGPKQRDEVETFFTGHLVMHRPCCCLLL